MVGAANASPDRLDEINYCRGYGEVLEYRLSHGENDCELSSVGVHQAGRGGGGFLMA